MTAEKNSKKILIVEDDMILSMVLERMIRKLNYRVAAKEVTGRGAIKTAQAIEPDLILMDIQLKDGVDGIEAMQQIRTMSAVPVIYITGNSDEHNLERARKTNFIEYLVKPIQMDDLKDSIERALSQAS